MFDRASALHLFCNRQLLWRAGRTDPSRLGPRGSSSSRSTKGVLLSTDGDVLCKAYQLSKGNPIQDTIDIFEELRQYERVRREQIAKEFAGLARRQHEHIKTKRLLPLIDHRFDHGAGERAVQ
jgi:activator of 2-hydroxyglutaryl-CoA dehydratase